MTTEIIILEYAIHSPTIHDPAMHHSCINYANMLTLYRDNSWYQGKKKYKQDMWRPGFFGAENF